MWVLPKGLPPQVLVGTTAIFFAVVNVIKLPAYLALGQFTRENLLASAVLTPLAIVSTLAGVWVVRRLDVERFNLIMYVLMIVLGVQLLFKALI